jgi:Asp-tRNA(Asn)/Glu-tRNA(Gln) amidotransferase A subunit family amidase
MDRRQFMTATGSLLGAAAIGAHRNAAARPLAFADYGRHDATGLAELVRKGEVSAAELLETAIARRDAVDPLINSVVMRHDDLARAAIAAGLPAGPLRGVPFLLKDLGVALAGTVTTHGSAFFRDARAERDSTLVQRYRAAGLVIFGKTASPEFGQTATTESRLWGATRNPWQRQHSAGGSSGGAAAAVAAGIIPAAHASDGGGSIRIPAAHCGLFGLKTSRGRLPFGPASTENWMGLSVQHAISRSVRDSALLLDLSQGPEAGSRVVPPIGDTSYLAALSKPVGRLRIALWDSHIFGQPVHADCRAALAAAGRLCESLGHFVEPATLDLPVQEMFAAMGVMTGTGLLTSLHDREKQLGRKVTEQDIEPINWRHYQAARQRSAEELYRARATFDRVGRILDEFLTRYDVLLSPVTAGPPPRLGELSLDQPYERFVSAAINASPFTALWNMGGHPAMAVPLHWNDAGLPIGSQFAGRYGDEVTLLRLAAQLEQAAPWAGRRPDIRAD